MIIVNVIFLSSFFSLLISFNYCWCFWRYVCKCTCLGIYLWRTDVDVRCFLPSFSNSYFEIQSLTEHGIFQQAPGILLCPQPILVPEVCSSMLCFFHMNYVVTDGGTHAYSASTLSAELPSQPLYCFLYGFTTCVCSRMTYFLLTL